MSFNNHSSGFMPTINRMAVIVVVLLSVGCARTYQTRYVETSHFLNDYTLLKEGEVGDALLSFWKEGVHWSSYKKIMIDPITVSKLPDSDLNEMTHAQIHKLKDLFEYRMRAALRKNFKLVVRPGADTLRIQFAITDAETSTLLLDSFTAVYPSARALSLLKRLITGTESYVGKASFEVKITDSQTGDLLMAAADSRAGGKTIMGSFNDWDDVEQAYQYWATQLSYQLCTKQGHSDCIEPE